MSAIKDTDTTLPSLREIAPLEGSARLAKWRAERLEIAEAERLERLRKRDVEKRLKEEHTRQNREQAARAMLPSQSEIAKREVEISKEGSRLSVRGKLLFVGLVVLPLLSLGVYLWTFATPLFEVRSVVAITSPAARFEPGQTGLLNTISTPSDLQDVFKAQAYIQSQSMLDALEDETGAVSRWSSAEIDPLQRMRDLGEFNLSKQAQLPRFVDSHVDVQTGLLTVVIRDPDPDRARDVANVVLALAEERLVALNERLVGQQLQQAQSAVETAKRALTDAQETLLATQLRSGEVDPRLQISKVYDTIQRLEEEAMTLEAEVQRTEISGRGDSFLARQARQLQERTEAAIAEQRQKLTMGADGSASLNEILMENDRASLQVRIAEDGLESAFQALAAATKATSENRTHFQVIVPPMPAAVASSPDRVSIMALAALLLTSCFVFVSLIRAGRA